jgi:hypothetical protein
MTKHTTSGRLTRRERQITHRMACCVRECCIGELIAGLGGSDAASLGKPPAPVCARLAKVGAGAGIRVTSNGIAKDDPSPPWSHRAAEIWRAPIDSMALPRSIKGAATDLPFDGCDQRDFRRLPDSHLEAMTNADPSTRSTPLSSAEIRRRLDMATRWVSRARWRRTSCGQTTQFLLRSGAK